MNFIARVIVTMDIKAKDLETARELVENSYYAPFRDVSGFGPEGNYRLQTRPVIEVMEVIEDEIISG